ncbi:MAG: protein YgfX [Pseudomonadota bacterium]
MHEFELKPSRSLGLLLAGMTVLAWGALGLATLPLWARLGLGIGLGVLAVRAWRAVSRPGRLRVLADGRVQRLDATDAWEELAVCGDSFVSAALIVLRYRTADGRAHALTLLPDSADADALRRLRVSLRWASRTRSDTASPDAG